MSFLPDTLSQPRGFSTKVPSLVTDLYDPAIVTSWGSLEMLKVIVGMFSLPNLG